MCPDPYFVAIAASLVSGGGVNRKSMTVQMERMMYAVCAAGLASGKLLSVSLCALVDVIGSCAAAWSHLQAIRLTRLAGRSWCLVALRYCLHTLALIHND